MNCPACERQLSEKTVGNVRVDVCDKGCGGIWFDRFEMKKLADLAESSGEALLDIERDKSISVDREARKNCPKCRDMMMMQHFFSSKKEVEVDECPKCGGHWLDSGELGKIRGNYSSEDDRIKAAQSYFSEIFDNQLANMELKSKIKSEKVQSIARIFRFITPSWYIKRK